MLAAESLLAKERTAGGQIGTAGVEDDGGLELEVEAVVLKSWRSSVILLMKVRALLDGPLTEI